MQVDLIERTPVRIVYLRYTGPYGRPLADFWRKRVMPWIASRHLGDRAMFAISLDNPNVTAPERCRCDIGVEVDDAFTAIDNEQIKTIAGGRYASSRFYDTVDHIADAWREMMAGWLPASAFAIDTLRPTFEFYPTDMRFDQATGAFECDLLVPIKPK